MFKIDQNSDRFLIYLVFFFQLSLLAGYSVGFLNLFARKQITPQSIQYSVRGLPEDMQEQADEIILPKTLKEMIVTTHNHVIVLSIVFLIEGILFLSLFHSGVVRWIVIEPFVSLLLTFGSLWLIFFGVSGFSYIAFISGIVMHSIFYIMALSIIYRLLKLQKKQ
jgi:hypothetical protein